MEVSLEVLISKSIKRRKPCPRICWLGQEKESVFLVDENHLSELSLHSGNVKKAGPRLQALLKKKSIVTLVTSVNGAYAAGLLLSGELFIWNKDHDLLQTVPANPEIVQVITKAQGLSLKLYLYVSGDGSRVLLAIHTGCLFLWESTEKSNVIIPSKNPSCASRWTEIQPPDSAVFPGAMDKEATIHIIFVKNKVLGDCCLCTFAFYSGTRLMMTFLSLRWYENVQRYSSSLPYHVHWAQQNCSLDTLVPSCEPVKSRTALLTRFSRDGLVLAVTVNQRDPQATQILFINTMNFVTVSGHLRGCGSKDQNIPARLIRSYWVGDMSWTADGLFLACLLKRGALVLLTRLGELLTLTTFGCSVEFGPAEFIPLHPFITYRPPQPILECHDANNSLGSSASNSDVMRQRYSITCHPRLPYLIVSDGYMVTALRFAKDLSPCYFLKSLLLDSAQRLESIQQSLHLPKPKDSGIKLRSLSSLKANLLKDQGNPYSATSTVPSFLQAEEDTGYTIEQSTLQGEEEESDDQNYTKLSVPTDVSFGGAEQGRLEFASMFDTIHAKGHCEGQTDLSSELHQIHKTLLTAWAVGVAMRNQKEKDTLLNYTVGCLTHLLSILQNYNSSSPKPDKLSKKMASGNAWILYLKVFQQCLTVLYWDVAPRQAIRHIIKLTSETLKLILTQHKQLYSKRLVESLCLLKLVSQHLSSIYNLHYEALSILSSGSSESRLDLLKIPVFEAVKSPPKGLSVLCVLKQPPEAVKLTMTSEKRLAVLWRLLYKQTLWYQACLRQQRGVNWLEPLSPKVDCEEQAVWSLLCHIQAELQSAGKHLDQSLCLLPVTGEEHFLLGSYKESVAFWRRALLEVTSRGGRRASLLQTRYCLAVLYSHLYNYNLKDAQGMCDQHVRTLLRRSNLVTDAPRDRNAVSEQLLLEDVHPEAALSVIQSMGRFMAAYFTNQLLFVFPPHNVCVLPSLHITSGSIPRMVTLQHSTVAAVVRDQNLSCAWTVEYALDLLLIGGLLPEAAWLANKLGDWKMSVSMGVAYNLYWKNIPDEFKRKEVPLPVTLSPAHIFQEKLQSFLGRPPSSETLTKDYMRQKQFTDPIEEEDADLLFSSVQEMLKAAVMADAEILTETLHQLMDSSKELSRKLPGLVPDRFYLPAPPLYCPQPASVSEEDLSDLLLEAEKKTRQKLSGVLQRILLLLRAARCSLPAAQWYIKQLKRARKVMQKIRAKGSLPPLNALPETLLNYCNSSTMFFKPGHSGNHPGDIVSASIIGQFRQLCALCWMLHVRERLSYSCRQYQKARDNGKLFKSVDEYDCNVTEHCFAALEWACRMLPFTRAMNCEELVQDIILSLISELPPVRKVADIMVKAFPRAEDVRVPLREKYHSVQQRLRHSMVKGPQGEEMMSIIIHNVQRVRVKCLKRVQRNIGPVEMYLWEPALEETSEQELNLYDRFSLGTSLTRSTPTDCGRPQVYSDADTLSEALMTNDADERSEWHVTEDTLEHNPRKNKPEHDKGRNKSEVASDNVPILPKVGTWEFESDDEEYTSFLNLFLSFLLEKDLLHHSEPGIPFLTSFTHLLREHELNSLVFDVHTTLKRKLGKAKIQSVFRAGSCYTINTGPCNDSKLEDTLLHTQGASDLNPNLASALVVEKPEALSHKHFHKLNTRRSVRSGLFGLQDQRSRKSNECDPNLSSTFQSRMSVHDEFNYRVIQTRNCVPSEELDMELQAKFINEAKLVEWMIRWSDRRLFWSAGKGELFQPHSTAIRVKTSSAAILTSIWLLEKPYMVPPSEYIVAPVSQPVAEPKLHSMDNGHSLSERDVITSVEKNEQQQPEESISETAEPAGTSGACLPTLPPIPNTPCVSSTVPASTTQQDSHSGEQRAQPSNTSEAVRELFQDEMFRLLQLQQLNFMSLMQVVGSSFAAVPAMHQILLQSSQMGRDQEVHQTVRGPAPPPPHFLAPVYSHVPPSGVYPAAQRETHGTGDLMDYQAMGRPATLKSKSPTHANIPSSDVCPELQTETNGGVDLQNCNRSCVPGRETHDQTNKENIQHLPELSIPLSNTNNEGKVPENHGVLPTAHNQSLPLISPSTVLHKTPSLVPTTKVLSNINGLPLLKLQHEPRFIPLHLIMNNTDCVLPPREAWGPSVVGQSSTVPHPTRDTTQIPSQMDLNKKNSSSEDKKRKRIETIINGMPKHFSEAQYGSQRGTTAQSQKPQEREKRPQNAFSRAASQNVAGIPLLCLQTDPVPYFPPFVARDPVTPSQSNANYHTSLAQPTLTLLKTNLPQHTQGLPFGPTPRLIPLQSLIAFEQRYSNQVSQGTAGGTLQLLKANIEPFEALVKSRDSMKQGDSMKFGDSIKRQKRRSRQQKYDKSAEKKDKKASVTFRPEDSIINPNNFDEIVQVEDIQFDEPGLEQSNEFVIPLGMFESLLPEQITGSQVPSVAELHWMAATKKRPPEIRDASTNTDSASKVHQNTETAWEEEHSEFPSNQPAASHSTAVGGNGQTHKLKPEQFLDSARREECDEDRGVTFPQLPAFCSLWESDLGESLDAKEWKSIMVDSSSLTPCTLVGHTIDIEERNLEMYLPDLAEHRAPFLENSSEVPSSAELHHMAASVTSAVPPVHPQVREDFSVTTVDERQRMSYAIVRATDRVTHKMLSGDSAPVPSTELASRPWIASAPGMNPALCRLQEMDAQLTALQNLADNMERDFANSELLVNTIENLATAIDPSPDSVVKFSTGPGATETGLPLGLDSITEEEDEFTFPNPSLSSLLPRIPVVHIASAKRPSDPQPATAPAAQNLNMDKSVLETYLNVTGLSDIADILNDLMEGGISAAELGLTETQAKTLSRERLFSASAQHSSKRTQQERMELQAWMKKKQRERMAEHRRRLEELREMEHNPFQPAQNANSSISSKTIRMSQRQKDEKDRSLLSEHHIHRVADALSLMQQMLSDAKQIPSAHPKSLGSTTRTSPSKSQGPLSSNKGSSAAMHSLPASRIDTRRTFSRGGFNHQRSISTPTRSQGRGTATYRLQKSNLDSRSRARSAPSYPVHVKYDTSLPGDRMSQITRRGMLVRKVKANVNTLNSTKTLLKSDAQISGSPHQDVRTKRTNVRSQPEGVDLEYKTERDVVSPWEVPEEINKLLNSDSLLLLSQRSTDREEVSRNFSKVENSSESTGSILSKLDWSAIEDMVASIDNT
ncbi:ciliogenesis and planar polarity effector 1 [Rhinophrynus dorsalis]